MRERFRYVVWYEVKGLVFCEEVGSGSRRNEEELTIWCAARGCEYMEHLEMRL